MPQLKKKSFIQKNGLIAVWTMAGFMAMGYIGFLATGNGNLKPRHPLVAQNQKPVIASQVSPVLQEVAALSAKVEDLTSREKKLTKQVTYLKDAFGVETSSLPEKKEPPVEKTTKIAANPEVTKTASTPEFFEKIAPLPKSTLAPKTYEKVTVNILPLALEDELMSRSPKSDNVDRYGIYLASARSIGSLKDHWNLLKKTNVSLIEGLEAHYINKSADHLPLYTLIAGPFKKMSQARDRCAMQTTDHIDCEGTRLRLDRRIEKVRTAKTLMPQ